MNKTPSQILKEKQEERAARKKVVQSQEGTCLMCDEKTETSRWTHIDTGGAKIFVDLCIHDWKLIALADHTHTKRLLQLATERVEA